MSSNVSYDLIWQVSRPYSSYLVKSRSAGGIILSSEPLNAYSVYRQAHSGFASEQAFGVKHTSKGIKLIAKDAKNANRPSRAVVAKKFSGKKHSGSKQGELIFAAANKANKLQHASGIKKN